VGFAVNFYPNVRKLADISTTNNSKEVMPLNSETLTTVKHKRAQNRPHLHHRLPCPACHFERLIDTGQHTKSQTFTAGEPGYNDADYYQKCFCCKAEIGIRKIE